MDKRTGPIIIAAVMALGSIGGLAHGAAAAPADQAVCVAENIAFARSTFGQADFVQIVVEDAHDGGAGDTIALNATTDCAVP
jgi:hypothetical protein